MNNTSNTTHATMSPVAADQVVRKSMAATSKGTASFIKKLSKSQRNELKRFVKIFPTEKDVIAFFAPAKWAAALENKGKCLDFSMVTLSILRYFYSNDIAVQIVKNNLVGLYTVARPHEFINEQALNLTAGLFVGKCGRELSVFGMLYYFASYLTTYRNSYTSFDLQDVLRQCDQKFLPQWRSSVQRNMRNKQEHEKAEETDRAALYNYLRREYVAKGRDVRESNIYWAGVLEEDEIPLIESMEPLAF